MVYLIPLIYQEDMIQLVLHQNIFVLAISNQTILLLLLADDWVLVSFSCTFSLHPILLRRKKKIIFIFYYFYFNFNFSICEKCVSWIWEVIKYFFIGISFAILEEEIIILLGE